MAREVNECKVESECVNTVSTMWQQRTITEIRKDVNKSKKYYLPIHLDDDTVQFVP